MRKLIVVETIKAKPRKMAALKEALLGLVDFSLKEDGCIQYEVASSHTAESVFLVLMRWEDVRFYNAHSKSKHILEFVERYENVLYDEVEETLWTI